MFNPRLLVVFFKGGEAASINAKKKRGTLCLI
jgi:hypothetical protein